MTVNQLIKQLQKLQDRHGKRMQVVMDWKACQHERFSHIPIVTTEVQVIPWAKGDSFELADGSERMKSVITLNGE